jgi:hypothetical protein
LIHTIYDEHVSAPNANYKPKFPYGTMT